MLKCEQLRDFFGDNISKKLDLYRICVLFLCYLQSTILNWNNHIDYPDHIMCEGFQAQTGEFMKQFH